MRTSIQAESERRQHTRYGISDDVFLTFRPQFETMGKVKDISRGGAAFEYTAFTESNSTKDIEVDIFSAAEGFHVARIPCKVVYDVQVNSHPNLKNLVTKRCGLEFQNLTSQQLAQLSSLFTRYAPLPNS